MQFLILCGLAAGLAQAKAPSADDLKKVATLVADHDRQRAAGMAASRTKAGQEKLPEITKKMQAIRKELLEALEGIDLAAVPGSAAPAVVDALERVNQPERLQKLAPRVEALAKEETLDGAAAATQLHKFVARPKVPLALQRMPGKAVEKKDEAETKEALAAYRKDVDAYGERLAAAHDAALKHPKFRELTAAGKLPKGYLSLVLGSTRKGLSPERAKLLAGLATAEAKLDGPTLFALAEALAGSAAPKADRERVRKLAVEAVKDSPNGERMLPFLEGAAMKGELIGHPAPKTTFLWSNDPAKPKSLADFKGKVVLIDFWATWCGPCIGSFPKIKEMVQHYEGCPVVVVSLTNPQGNISYPKKQGDERRKDNLSEKEELELLAEWAKDMDMAWTVVCGKESCFNPDFGVRGIPHMAILAPDGTVRHNGVNFRAGEAEPLIDALLKEFKLPLPKPSDKPKPAEKEKEKAAAPKRKIA